MATRLNFAWHDRVYADDVDSLLVINSTKAIHRLALCPAFDQCVHFLLLLQATAGYYYFLSEEVTFLMPECMKALPHLRAQVYSASRMGGSTNWKGRAYSISPPS